MHRFIKMKICRTHQKRDTSAHFIRELEKIIGNTYFCKSAQYTRAKKQTQSRNLVLPPIKTPDDLYLLNVKSSKQNTSEFYLSEPHKTCYETQKVPSKHRPIWTKVQRMVLCSGMDDELHTCFVHNFKESFLSIYVVHVGIYTQRFLSTDNPLLTPKKKTEKEYVFGFIPMS